ncbi:glutamine amidotransferase-related protein [Coprobacillus cateniformis]|uniref:glutamine amidotransferase-related protein n=1 Tax=Coprobacillus cateniformis TaxID=100884 RepID=UPI0034A194EF
MLSICASLTDEVPVLHNTVYLDEKLLDINHPGTETQNRAPKKRGISQLIPKTKAYQMYGKEIIQQRHRHRYEFNNKYRKILEEHGLTISGVNPERNLVEIIELKNHPYFIASQFHPEFKSRPNRSEPLFQGFITAASDRKYKK